MEIPVGADIDSGNRIVALILFTVQIVQSNAAHIQQAQFKQFHLDIFDVLADIVGRRIR